MRCDDAIMCQPSSNDDCGRIQRDVGCVGLYMCTRERPANPFCVILSGLPPFGSTWIAIPFGTTLMATPKAAKRPIAPLTFLDEKRSY